MKTGDGKIGARAAEIMRQGLHCSEAILRWFNTELGLGLDDAALKMATGFAGGIGCARDVCGALTGAIMVIGALYGRSRPGIDDQKCQELCKRLRADFINEFGSSSCEYLTKGVWGATNQQDLCADRITSRTAELLHELLLSQERSEASGG